MKRLLLFLLFLTSLQITSWGQCPAGSNIDSDGDGVLDCIDPCIDTPSSIIGNLSFESDFIGWTIPQNEGNFSITQEVSNTLHDSKALYVTAPNAANFENHAIYSEEFTLEEGIGYSFRIPAKRIGNSDGDALRWALVDENGVYRHLNNYYNWTEEWSTISINNLQIDLTNFSSNRFRLRLEFGLSQTDMVVDRIEFFETNQGFDPTYADFDSDGLPDCGNIDVSNHPDYNALVAVYNSLGGANWTNNTNWLDTTKPLSTWFGIAEENGRVVDLILNNNNLVGTIPSEIENLTNVKRIIFGTNSIYGTIPPQMGNLLDLEFLNLNTNNLEGEIPSSFNNLSKIKRLYLYNNSLSGTIPSGFSSFTALEQLLLSNNNLEGPIPNLTGNTGLNFLWLDNNKFIFADFENEFPIYQANIDNFQYTPQKQLDPKPNIIAVNGQEISVSADVSGLDNIYFWFKRNNNNTSTVISNDENLSFTLDENNSGTYFLEVSSSLVPNLLLTSPDFSIGQDPTSSPDFDVLVEFYNTTNGNIWLNNANWLNPNIPLSEWFGLTVENNRVTEINLFNNGLSGEIPTSITDLTEIKTLSLSGNNLAGTIPELSILPAIEFVNINNNDFSFLDFEPHFNSNISIQNFVYSFQNLRDTPIEFEPVIGNNYEFFMTDVQGTDVQYQWYKEVFQALDPFSEPVEGATSNTLTFNNIQSGELSTYFCAATSSLIPDLVIRRGNVALTGPVSQQERDALIAFYNALDGDNWTNNTNWLTAAPVRDWIGVNTTGNKVTGLTLGFSGISNASGEIPEEIGDLTHLVFLDFALNSITGNLPASFTNLTNLRRIRLQGLPMSGTLPENIGNLTKLEEILIVFSGFTGPIPSNIGNLTNLRRFDMNGNLLGGYKNNLSGELPASLGNLTNLGLLRLDQNSLEGQIPSNLSNLAADTQFGLTINLVNNNFSGPLPDWSLLPNPSSTQIFLQENLFGFGDLEPLVNNGVSYALLNYSPQRTNDIEETIDSGEGADITLNVNDTNLNRDIEDTAMNNEYQWFKDGALITGANASSYNILNAQESDSGVYFCQITNDLLPDLIINRANITLNVDSTLTIESLNSNDFSLYPNPVSNWLTIKIGSNAEAKVTIVDINGKQLLEKEIHTNISSLNVEQLPAGVYLITITNNNASSTKRFIKQ